VTRRLLGVPSAVAAPRRTRALSRPAAPGSAAPWRSSVIAIRELDARRCASSSSSARRRLSNSAFVDPKTIFVTFSGKVFGGTGGNLLNWLIALMLIVALALSALNAIMGCARSLHQMSVDGQFPRFFQKINKNGVPDRAMFFNVICSLVVILAGGAVEIYSFSNVGYTFSFLPVLVGYYLLRK